LGRGLGALPKPHRQAADLDGLGETADAMGMVRFGENVLSVIERGKETITRTIAPLPDWGSTPPSFSRKKLVYSEIESYLLLKRSRRHASHL